MADCIQCRYMDLNDKDKYGDAYCSLRKKYYNHILPLVEALNISTKVYLIEKMNMKMEAVLVILQLQCVLH